MQLAGSATSSEQRLERGLRFCCIIKFSPEWEPKNSPLKTWTLRVEGGSVLLRLDNVLIKFGQQGRHCQETLGQRHEAGFLVGMWSLGELNGVPSLRGTAETEPTPHPGTNASEESAPFPP